MNGAAKPGDRPTRDPPAQADAPASPDSIRKAMFSLPSLRGATRDTHTTDKSLAFTSNYYTAAAERGRAPAPAPLAPLSQHQPLTNSQDTTAKSSSATDSETHAPVFSPAFDGPARANGHGRNSHESSQESQLFQLSELAAAREKLPADVDMITSPPGANPSRKRMADGAVKHGRSASSTSPIFSAQVGGHSRNMSTVSLASTVGSRAGRFAEMSQELKTRLKYAMVKVQNGWESHDIAEVESLASRAPSPNSTVSTAPGGAGSSASPRVSSADSRSPTRLDGRVPGAGLGQRHPNTVSHMQNIIPPATASTAMSPPPVLKAIPSLAPPVSIKPSLSLANPRRNSIPTFSPAYLSHGYAAASPRTPAEAVSTHGTPRLRTARTPMVDPIIFSPHQNVREQDAIESLLFMSSPGNSANLKHTFPSSSSQPVISSRTGIEAAGGSSHSHRTALPSGQPRRTLPSSRPAHQPQPTRRVGFEHTSSNLGEMEIDGSPHALRGTPKRKLNGQPNGHHDFQAPPTPKPTLKLPAPLGATSRPRGPELTDADIDKMLDNCLADESSDSDLEEIALDVRHQGMEVMRS